MKPTEVKLSKKIVSLRPQFFLRVHYVFEIRLRKILSYRVRPTEFFIRHQMKCGELGNMLNGFSESFRRQLRNMIEFFSRQCPRSPKYLFKLSNVRPTEFLIKKQALVDENAVRKGQKGTTKHILLNSP